jgi:hypothetical protein
MDKKLDPKIISFLVSACDASGNALFPSVVNQFRLASAGMLRRVKVKDIMGDHDSAASWLFLLSACARICGALQVSRVSLDYRHACLEGIALSHDDYDKIMDAISDYISASTMYYEEFRRSI